jgi:acid phosphatase
MGAGGCGYCTNHPAMIDWRSFSVVLLLAAGCIAAAPAPPKVAHVTIVMMENRNYPLVVGNADAPYFNQTLIPQGVLLTNMHAIRHPSEPNYLALFSGSTHGLTDDSCPHTYASANLASELDAAGLTFGGYAESMPSPGFQGCWGAGGLYGRKHIPWPNFSNVPASQSAIYNGALPSPMPSLAWIVPNMCHDMHDCSTRTGDEWLAKNLPPIVAWNAKNDGLLIVTWDEAEPDADGRNRIPTLLVGPMVVRGKSGANVSLYNLTRTIEWIFSLPCIADECKTAPLAGIWAK